MNTSRVLLPQQPSYLFGTRSSSFLLFYRAIRARQSSILREFAKSPSSAGDHAVPLGSSHFSKRWGNRTSPRICIKMEGTHGKNGAGKVMRLDGLHGTFDYEKVQTTRLHWSVICRLWTDNKIHVNIPNVV